VIIRVVAAIIRRGTHLLITRRPSDVHLAGLWEFPGGKVEPGESLSRALEREIREELDVTLDVGGEFFHVAHTYPELTVELHFFDCRILAGDPRPLQVAELRWVLPAELNDYHFPEADRELISRLQA
jgi:mutator protein MutT